MKFEQLTRFARGFVYAYNGIRAAVQEERNFRFHLCAAFYAFVAAFWAELDPVETALIALCVAAVLALELVNSAIERAVDKPDTTTNAHAEILLPDGSCHEADYGKYEYVIMENKHE